MEKISSINSRVENIRTPEECTRELISFQLKYLEKVEQGFIKRPNINNLKKEYSNNFFKILAEHTSIEGYLEDEYMKRFSDIKEWGTSSFEYNRGFFMEGIIRKIYELYLNDKDNWKSKAMELIDNALGELGPVVNDLDKLNNKKQEKCGLINFDIEVVGNPKNIEKLKTFGLNSCDDYINIHFKDLFKQKLDDTFLGLSSVSKSFNLLAERIIDEQPQVKAVIGRSWIMDSKFGEKLHFKIFDRHENSVFTTGSFWGQFIDENGYIKKVEIDNFLKEGVARFYPAEGIILVEDFLREYLPKERRGVVKLREISPKTKLEKIKIDKIIETVGDNLGKLSLNKIFSLIESNPFLANFYKTEDGKRHKEMLIEFKKSFLENMKDFVYSHKEDIDDKFNQYINSYKYDYIEKEVNIE